MILAIMQPYIFPYIGYFQLLNAVDKFVIYDDVTFIKQGWINRNNILLNGKAYLFTVPLVNVSSNVTICNTQIANKKRWEEKFIKTMQQAYKKAPYYANVIDMIHDIISIKSDSIGDLATNSIKTVAEFIGIDTQIQYTSSMYNNNFLSSQERVLDICKAENADRYINAAGGQNLYSKQDFKSKGIELNFIKSGFITYQQFGESFISSLSVIDVIMFNDPKTILNFTNQYEMI